MKMLKLAAATALLVGMASMGAAASTADMGATDSTFEDEKYHGYKINITDKVTSLELTLRQEYSCGTNTDAELYNLDTGSSIAVKDISGLCGGDSFTFEQSISAGTQVAVVAGSGNSLTHQAKSDYPYPETTSLFDVVDGIQTASLGGSYSSNSWAYTFRYITAYQNEIPQFNSSQVSPDPPLIGDNVSYSADVDDPDGDNSQLSTTLTVFKDGSSVAQETQSGSPVNFSDVYTVQSGGSLDARFETTDSAGATTTEWINRTLKDKNPGIEINSPDNTIKDSQTFSWNVSSINNDAKPDEAQTLNIYKNGNLDQSYSITEGDTETGTITYNDGVDQEFKAELVEDDGDSNSSTKTFDVDTQPPEISIDSPSGQLSNKKDLDLKYNVDDPHLDSSTCEYSKDGGTRFSISNCENTTIDFNTVGEHNVTVYAEDTLGFEASDTSNFETDYENRITAKDQDSGSTIQDLEVTFNNGTTTSGGSTNDGTFEINTSDVPQGSTNMTLKTSGYKIRTINLSVDDSFELRKTYDLERSSLTIDAKGEKSGKALKFNFTARNSTTSYTQENISKFQEDYHKLTNIGFPTGAVTVNIQDAEGDYKKRKYFITMDENSVISLVGYLLKPQDGIFVSVETYDSKQSVLQNVQVTAEKQINGSYRQVSQGVTGTDGATSFFLDPDVQYRAVASKSGYSTFSGTFNPVNYQYDPLKIQLGESGKYNFTTRWDTINYKLEPQDKFLNKSKEETISWKVNDIQGDLTEFGLRVKNKTGGLIKQSNIKNSPSGGEVNVTINGSKYSKDKKFYTEAYLITSGKEYRIEKLYEFERSWTAGIFSLSNILDTTGNGVSNTTRGIISLFVSMMAGIGFGSRLGRSGAGFIVIMILGIFSLSSWFPIEIWILGFLAMLGVYLYE